MTMHREAAKAEADAAAAWVHVEALIAENMRLRKALERIASAESGVWGRMAHEALHPEGQS